MNEYINKQALIQGLTDFIEEHRYTSNQYTKGYYAGIKAARDAIKTFPRANVIPASVLADEILDRDYVKVTRCRDCGHLCMTVGYGEDEDEAYYYCNNTTRRHLDKLESEKVFDFDYFCKDGYPRKSTEVGRP